MMSIWTVLGLGWMAACFVLGVFALRRGFLSMVTWFVFGGGIWGMHAIASASESGLPSNLAYTMYLLKGLSLLLLLWACSYAIRVSLSGD